MRREIKNELNWEEKPSVCSICSGRLCYRSHGEYICESCGNIDRDDFGKVRNYIEVNGPTPALLIAEGTGVPMDKINAYLRQGRVEIPEGSSIYITCEGCGRDIRFGRFCPDCAIKLSKQIQGALEVGDVPRFKAPTEGTMHFIGRDDLKKRKK